jgi:hypothetical protein
VAENEREHPPCFGDLETVFPLGSDGLRHSPPECMRCEYNTDCMRLGLRGGGGLKVREESLERAYASGAVGFWERWSRKKALHLKQKGCAGKCRR